MTALTNPIPGTYPIHIRCVEPDGNISINGHRYLVGRDYAFMRVDAVEVPTRRACLWHLQLQSAGVSDTLASTAPTHSVPHITRLGGTLVPLGNLKIDGIAPQTNLQFAFSRAPSQTTPGEPELTLELVP